MEKSEVRKLLRQLGYRSKYRGYEYLVDMIFLMSNEPNPNKRTQAVYCKEIADKYNTNEKAVEKAIGYLINKNYKIYGNSLLDKVIELNSKERLSIKQILNLISDYVSVND